MARVPAPTSGVVVVPLASDDPVALALVAALEAYLGVRYEDLDEDSEVDLSLVAVEPADVAPPWGTFLIARLGGRPVGCGALRAVVDRPGVAEVKRMYVAPEARGRGVARALLAALEADARHLSYRGLILETGTRQPEAMALYESSGWVPTPRYGAYRTFAGSRCYAKDLG